MKVSINVGNVTNMINHTLMLLVRKSLRLLHCYSAKAKSDLIKFDKVLRLVEWLASYLEKTVDNITVKPQLKFVGCAFDISTLWPQCRYRNQYKHQLKYQ